ncbi:hypothetical protein BDY17DRAFT_357022 [Neohortaea acidophila]|uniref:Uncharacterized protein n=1 Tax=Neohortaea acidophila TaxID=245834 RepID=A0A6A6PES5_9PEZI|nr:uncharacterized protein BDY17DRAFT_357022 [Neohortaea acidophila]KAF2478435.1 hypothetical protein BDY17DRAFT_357022 [Neohortaea acidophila]
MKRLRGLSAATTKIVCTGADAELYKVPELDAPSDETTTSSLEWLSDDDDDETPFDNEADSEHALVRVALHSAIPLCSSKPELWDARHCGQLISEAARKSPLVMTSEVEIVDLDD